MIFEKLQIHNKSDLEFFEKIYIESFPPSERRSLLKMFHLIEKEERFSLFIILNSQKERIGFISLWNLESFVYMEHFAISSDFRNGGYGKSILHELINNTNKPIVGEIELPSSSDMAARRKLFYEKIGFKASSYPYEQPPYEDGFEPIPMLLISYGNLELEYNKIKSILYSTVYNKLTT